MRLILNLALLLLRAGALALALGCALLAIAAQGGRWSATLDTAAHFSPLWLVGGLLAAVLGALVSRQEERRAILVVAATAVILSGLQMAPELWARATQETVAPGGETLKVIQFNAWGDNDDPEGSARWVIEQNADIVLVEESYGGRGRFHKLLREAYPHRTACPRTRPCQNLILSKEEPTEQGDFADRPGERNGRPFLSVVYAKFGEGDRAFTAMNAHYAWPWPAGYQQAQSAALAEKLTSFDHDNLILTGDFNSTPWSFTLQRQDKAFAMERRTRAMPSWPARFERTGFQPLFPILPIDHVYAGKAWRTVKVERGPRLGSDHRPVVVTLTRVGR
ncbi:endonuclease/exonuclease/phosphatase family protein [Caulobacter segnis]|uniref:endonuclease/exonuclease/phosphatase family protein n=1 Tax=Caulobacter segnis TaxID=88688 RepID=UPI00240FE847|nr:endonuclease/exonuclease/phosphatase family protein [Caulobacter segnis]MDG2522419.1 endonuclease/exonuclease/phosphatase family protein [Caulobacter segnis]